ncbi:MAG: hypothetical protein LBM98_11205 [Oscillospiraceae bacterium]|nr:hypothetical protein [Oscillospiraceae bacterium]
MDGGRPRTARGYHPAAYGGTPPKRGMGRAAHGAGTTPAAEAAPPSSEGGFLVWTWVAVWVVMETRSVTIVQIKKAPFAHEGGAASAAGVVLYSPLGRGAARRRRGGFPAPCADVFRFCSKNQLLV